MFTICISKSCYGRLTTILLLIAAATQTNKQKTRSESRIYNRKKVGRRRRAYNTQSGCKLHAVLLQIVLRARPLHTRSSTFICNAYFGHVLGFGERDMRHRECQVLLYRSRRRPLSIARPRKRLIYWENANRRPHILTRMHHW